MTDQIALTGTLTCTPAITPEQWSQNGFALLTPPGEAVQPGQQSFLAGQATGPITTITTTGTDTVTGWREKVRLLLAGFSRPPHYTDLNDYRHFKGMLYGRDTAGQRYVIAVEHLMIYHAVIQSPDRLAAALLRSAQAYLTASESEEDYVIGNRYSHAETFDPTTRPRPHRLLLADDYLYYVAKLDQADRVRAINYGMLAKALESQHYTYADPPQAIAAVAQTLASMLGIEDAYHRALQDLATGIGQHHIDPSAPKRQAMLIAATADQPRTSVSGSADQNRRS